MGDEPQLSTEDIDMSEPNDLMPDDRDPWQALAEFERMLNDPEQKAEFEKWLDSVNQPERKT